MEDHGRGCLGGADVVELEAGQGPDDAAGGVEAARAGVEAGAVVGVGDRGDERCGFDVGGREAQQVGQHRAVSDAAEPGRGALEAV